MEPEIDSAGGVQNLPWNFVEVEVGVEVGVEVEVEVEVEVGTRYRFCLDFQNLPWNYVEVVFLNAFFQPAIMFSGVSSFLQSHRVFPVWPVLSFSLLGSCVLS